jgi:FkbM family methyltransferase
MKFGRSSLPNLSTLIRDPVKGGINKTARALGFELRRLAAGKPSDSLATFFTTMIDLRNLRPVDTEHAFLKYCLANLEESRAQLLQDLFVLFTLGDKSGGYFVEFGATDGSSFSNTFILEKRCGWSGILAEPARCWHNKLDKNRDCSIDYRCVWKETGVLLEFIETEAAGFSTISAFSGVDLHAKVRMNGQIYVVETVSLTDLLRTYDAPKVIDYLSIDTEGSELEILSNFSFEDYEVRVITVEHNYTDRRSQIYDLLTSKGYRRVFDRFSCYDDWYLRTSTAEGL